MRKILFVLLLLISNVSAYDLVYGVFNLNTLQPIDNATIEIYNVTGVLYNNTITDNGYAIINIKNETGLYNNILRKVDYYSYTASTTIDSDETFIYYMTPISMDGLVKLTPNSIALSNTDLDVFFKDNMRLKKRYKINDTIILSTNHNYLIRPKVDIINFNTNPSLFEKNGFIILGLIMGLMVISFVLAFFVALIAIIYKTLKGRK